MAHQGQERHSLQKYTNNEALSEEANVNFEYKCGSSFVEIYVGVGA